MSIYVKTSNSSNSPKIMTIGTNRRFSAAEVKNRAEQAKLEAELAKIKKQKQQEDRSVNMDKQKLRSRYSKSSNEDTDGSMYETYSPGLRYKRSEERETDPSPDPTISLHFEHVHSLIFTNGEVDLEKVLCLHLLCAHRTETLKPSKKKVNYLCREHSPTERIIEKSKKGFTNYERLSKLLPLYSIELIEHEATEEKPPPLINDGRLASRILINEKIMALINTAATTLEKVNIKKFKQLIVMGNTPALMRKMLQNEHMAEFLDSLLDRNLINSPDAFVLTPPFKIKVYDLPVKTSHGNLEHLISQLRQNVLQEPTRDAHQEVMEEEVEMTAESLRGSTVGSASPKTEKKGSDASTVSTKTSPTRTGKVLAGASKMSAKIDLKRDVTRRSLSEEDHSGRYKKIDFIAKNKAAAGKTKKIEYDFEDDDYDYGVRKRSSTSSGSSGRTKMKIMEPVIPVKTTVLPVVTEKESADEKLVKSVESNKSNQTESEKLPDKDEKPQGKRPRLNRHEQGNHIRQSTCSACMERWKTPLPSPKTPRVKKSDLLPELYSNDLRTNSHHRISMMINKAMYKLQSYDRKYAPENAGARRLRPSKRDVEDEDSENVYLSPMDLARIEQEIKEKEAQKKLENFLDKYSKNNNNNQ